MLLNDLNKPTKQELADDERLFAKWLDDADDELMTKTSVEINEFILSLIANDVSVEKYITIAHMLQMMSLRQTARNMRIAEVYWEKSKDIKDRNRVSKKRKSEMHKLGNFMLRSFASGYNKKDRLKKYSTYLKNKTT